MWDRVDCRDTRVTAEIVLSKVNYEQNEMKIDPPLPPAKACLTEKLVQESLTI